MAVRTRPLAEDDVVDLVALALLAWEPVFESLRVTLGDDLFDRLRPDWRRDQEDAVRDLCRQENGATVIVAEHDAGRRAVGTRAAIPGTRPPAVPTSVPEPHCSRSLATSPRSTVRRDRRRLPCPPDSRSLEFVRRDPRHVERTEGGRECRSRT